MKPLIGITATPQDIAFDHGVFHRHCLSDTYSRSIIASGGIPVIIPSAIEDVGSLFDTLDGIVFSGGGDLDPSLFGADRHPETDGIDAERDAFELAAAREAVARDIPTLGICRGIQVINVALGGTLFQDIDSEVPSAIEHRQHKEGKDRDDLGHLVSLAPGAHPLRDILGKDSLQTNSFHHQAVKVPAHELEVIATTADGIIEAMWYPGMRFGLAVQWHPEMLSTNYGDHAKIFAAFVSAAARVASRA